jgi:HAD superfamily hydrolase (TIGR01490 family)
MTLAIFDIDGTLVRGSTERQFWRYLVAQHCFGPRQAVAYVWFLLRYLPRFGWSVLKKNKAYLCGQRVEDIDALAARFVDRHVVPQLCAPVVQRLEAHQRRGDAVVLVSGTLDSIARALALALGVSHVRATLCRQHDGRYTAQPPLCHPYDAAKLDIAAELAAELDVELARASAYGDSRYDVPLLAAVGTPVAVHPDAALFEVASAADWEVMPDDKRPPVTREAGYM